MYFCYTPFICVIKTLIEHPLTSKLLAFNTFYCSITRLLQPNGFVLSGTQGQILLFSKTFDIVTDHLTAPSCYSVIQYLRIVFDHLQLNCLLTSVLSSLVPTFLNVLVFLLLMSKCFNWHKQCIEH